MNIYLLIVLKAFLPVAATSFALVWWALRKDYLHGATSLGEYENLQKSEKQARKAAKKAERSERKAKGKAQAKAGSNGSTVHADVAGSDLEIAAELETLTDELQPGKAKHDFLHNKWMQFGGGFYGVVAFYTYVLIEIDEVWDFFVGLANLFNENLVRLVIQFFIQSFMNFIAAVTWPVYWLSRVHNDQWLWVIAAYAGYWLGAKAAFQFSQARTD